MHKHVLQKNKFIAKAILLLGVYLLHFAFFQSVVAGLSGSRHFSTRTIFSDSDKSHSSNNSIATFRTLEKHDVSQQTFKLSPASSNSIIFRGNLFSSLLPRQIEWLYSPSSFQLSDASYRLYLKECVFRI